MFLFLLDQQNEYQEVSESSTLSGLDKSLLEKTFAQLETMINMEAANWFQQQIVRCSGTVMRLKREKKQC